MFSLHLLYSLRDGSTNVLVLCLTGTLEMAPKKKRGGIGKSSQTCPYVVHPEERKRCVPIIEFMQGIGGDIMSVEAPPGQAAGATNAPARLIRRAQLILFRAIDMVLDILESDNCFDSLSENLIVVDEHFEIPRLLLNNLVEKSDLNVKRNLNELGKLLDHVVSEASDSYAKNKGINPEFKHLIQMMKVYQPGDCLFLMRYHVCNIPLGNRCFLYMAMYEFVMDILRFADQESFIFVMSHLIYPPDWFIKLQSNSYLASDYKKGHYDPMATQCPEETDPRMEPVRYHRNSPAHSLEETADANAEHGMLLTRAQLGLALYFVFPRLLTSMQTVLQYLGELSSLDIQDLFPGRVSIPKD